MKLSLNKKPHPLKVAITPDKTSISSIHLSPASITKVFTFIVLLLLVCHIVIVHLADNVVQSLKGNPNYAGIKTLYWAFYNQFHLALDGNLPTYFSSLLLFVAALLLFLIHRIQKGRSYYWLSISFIFLFLSVDESTQFHETFGGFVGNRAKSYMQEPPAFLGWGWMIPYSLMTLLVVVYYFKFVWKLPFKTRNLFFASGFIYVFASLFLEFSESHIQITYGSGTLANAILYPIEEILEMVGVVIFIYALLDYLKQHTQHVGIEIV